MALKNTLDAPWMKWGPPVGKYIFSEILSRGSQRGILPGRSQEAINWYRDTARSYKNVDRNKLTQQRSQFRNKIIPGSMYMFAYYAKHAETLPYWDAFPIIFPVSMYDDGFLGINFHYLPPRLRAVLMDKLYTIVNDPMLTEHAKIKLTWSMLNSVVRDKLFAPCVKRYLYSQFRSKFIYVDPDSWDIALFLPTENFQKASNQKVWAASRRKIS